MSCYLVAVVIGKFACDEVVSPARNDNMPYDRDYSVTVKTTRLANKQSGKRYLLCNCTIYYNDSKSILLFTTCI